MSTAPIRILSLCALVLCSGPGFLHAADGEAQPGSRTEWSDQDQPDPCRFYRSQAWRQGLTHYTRDMLWSCEAIAQRRQAGMQLSDRLTAADLALKAYRARIVEAALAHYRRSESLGLDTFHRRVPESEMRQIAEESGVLAAMEALSEGF